jgi:hypothetical protein
MCICPKLLGSHFWSNPATFYYKVVLNMNCQRLALRHYAHIQEHEKTNQSLVVFIGLYIEIFTFYLPTNLGQIQRLGCILTKLDGLMYT